MSKGSWQRPDVDKGKFLDEYDKIFKKGKYEEESNKLVKLIPTPEGGSSFYDNLLLLELGHELRSIWREINKSADLEDYDVVEVDVDDDETINVKLIKRGVVDESNE